VAAASYLAANDARLLHAEHAADEVADHLIVVADQGDVGFKRPRCRDEVHHFGDRIDAAGFQRAALDLPLFKGQWHGGAQGLKQVVADLDEVARLLRADERQRGASPVLQQLALRADPPGHCGVDDGRGAVGIEYRQPLIVGKRAGGGDGEVASTGEQVLATAADDEVTLAADGQVFGPAGNAVPAGRQVGHGIDHLHAAADVVDAARARGVQTLDDGFGEASLDPGDVALEGGGFDVGQVIGD